MPQSPFQTARDRDQDGQYSSAYFKLGNLLPSQAVFVFSPVWLTSYAGGWGTGKTVALCTRILTQLARQSYSRAAIMRLHASDLRDTTLPVWDEVVPESWVKRRVRTKGNEHDVLKNNSTVVFKHIHDAVKGRTHLASLNVAHIGIDQAEEITEDDFLKLISRARYRPDIHHSIALAFNPAGHNWIWRRLYQGARVMQGHPLPQLQKWDWLFAKERSLALAVPTLENTPQCGGYLPPGYYENLRSEYPPEWVARYLDCSFEDFQGKVYPRYSLDSEHNLDFWEVPEDLEGWKFGIGIDVGGASPWGIVRLAMDPPGRVYVYDEFYKANVPIREVAAWIQRDRHWLDAQNQGLIVIDPENKVAAQELQQYGVYAQVARKDKTANVLRVNTYLQPAANVTHPVTGSFGAPRLYFSKSCIYTRKEHDQRLWDDNGKPADEQDHTCDALEYIVERLPARESKATVTRLDKLATTDPASAQFWRAVRKKEQKQIEWEHEPLREMMMVDDLFDEGSGRGVVEDAFQNWE